MVHTHTRARHSSFIACCYTLLPWSEKYQTVTIPRRWMCVKLWIRRENVTALITKSNFTLKIIQHIYKVIPIIVENAFDDGGGIRSPGSMLRHQDEDGRYNVWYIYTPFVNYLKPVLGNSCPFFFFSHSILELIAADCREGIVHAPMSAALGRLAEVSTSQKHFWAWKE